MSSPKIKDISLLRNGKSGIHNSHPVLLRRASAVVTDVGRVAVDAEVTKTIVADSVRRRRVVLTSRCWRQCTWRQQLSGRNGGKRAVLRGEYVISRKAIAQGRPGVLRCPVCSCAFCFVLTAHETAGAARTRSSLRPVFEGGKFLAKLGRNASRECEPTFSCRHPRRRVTQYSRDADDRTEKPRRTGSPPARG